MPKIMLHLSIDPLLAQLAKSSGLNLSAEFEQWIKIRLNKMDDDNNQPVDTELEVAKLRAEIQRLETQAEINSKKENIQKEINMVLDNMIDNMVEYKEDLTNPSDTRVHGVQFLMHKKFNKVLNPLEAKELLLNRIKERNL